MGRKGKELRLTAATCPGPIRGSEREHMQKAWHILIHSWRQVVGNLRAALRISLLLYLVQVVVGFALDHAIGQKVAVVSGDDAASSLAALQTLAGPGLLSALVAVLAYLWIAVAWHRYVLTGEESPSWVPLFHGSRNLAYFGTLLLLGALFSLGAVAFTVVASLVLMVAGPAVAQVMPLLVILVFSAPAFRLSSALPGVALEPGHSLREGWEATRGETGVLYGLGVLWILVLVLLRIPDALFMALPGPIWLIWTLAVQWLLMMVGISILTTLYGHYIQKRPLI